MVRARTQTRLIGIAIRRRPLNADYRTRDSRTDGSRPAESENKVASKPHVGHQDNHLLAAIPQDIFTLFAADLKEANFEQGTVVQEAGDAVERVYFPQSGMISLLIVTRDGSAIEAATIGREGAVGLHGGIGKRRAHTRAVIQIPGRISYVSVDRFAKAVRNNGAVADIISRYTEFLWAEAQQIAACNAVHNAEARLCRWLLQIRDRVDSDTVPLTQELLSQMLGVRRTTVTLIARALQLAGKITYRRGKIIILDRKGLEGRACECYGVLRADALPAKIGIDLPGSTGFRHWNDLSARSLVGQE